MADGRCVIWWATLDQHRPAHDDLLDEVERRRAGAYRQAADRIRFTLGAAVLRLAASSEVGRAPERVVVARTCAHCGKPHGRPVLADTGLHLSISHSGDRVALAMTRLAPLGVDVEEVRSIDLDLLAGVVLDGGEPLEPEAFYSIWCRKEAVLKATGDGLRVPMNEVRVTPAHEPPGVVAYPGRPGLEVALADLRPAPGYAGALAVLHPSQPPVDERDAGALLT